MRDLIGGAAKIAGVQLNAEQVAQLTTHFELLLRWNEKINLSAVRQPAEIATRHFGESLFLSTLIAAPSVAPDVVPYRPATVMLDVGSGAGFPGLPLKVIWPDVPVVLLEPTQKKATFLREVIRQCRMQDASVVSERLEQAARGRLSGSCALVTMRAVAVDAGVLAALRGMLAEGGRVALFVGEAAARKLMSERVLRWETPRAIPHSAARVILLGSR